MIKNLEEDKGVMVFISHLGNSELLRGLAHSGETGVSKQFVVNAIADVGVTSKFNGLLKKINSSATMHLFNASGIGPDTMVQLQEKIAAGEMVVIAGDRISATSKNRFVDAPFLGHTAHFAYGAFLLAALLNAPTYFIFGLRKKPLSVRPQYNFYAHKNSVTFDCSRKEREERIKQMVAEYSKTLESLCLQNPYQWYNFFDFWKQ